jgi:hypothetical protein
MSWTPEQLAGFDAASEIEVAVRRADGKLRPWTPIWAVHVGGSTENMVGDDTAATALRLLGG